MSKRQNNQLPNNLPQLQNLIKRDPESYKEEFSQQLRHFSSTLQVFELTPTEFNENLHELIMFLAQVAKCYPDDLANYPQTLIDLLRKVRNLMFKLGFSLNIFPFYLISSKVYIYTHIYISAFNSTKYRYEAIVLSCFDSSTPQRSFRASSLTSTLL